MYFRVTQVLSIAVLIKCQKTMLVQTHEYLVSVYLLYVCTCIPTHGIDGKRLEAFERASFSSPTYTYILGPHEPEHACVTTLLKSPVTDSVSSGNVFRLDEINKVSS